MGIAGQSYPFNPIKCEARCNATACKGGDGDGCLTIILVICLLFACCGTKARLDDINHKIDRLSDEVRRGPP